MSNFLDFMAVKLWRFTHWIKYIDMNMLLLMKELATGNRIFIA
ncbi:hypothetical protein [Bacillus alkalicola]|nr:hypothetical protein [Bacillus alkalicola]